MTKVPEITLRYIDDVKEKNIENYCESCKPRYIHGEYVVVDEGKKN